MKTKQILNMFSDNSFVGDKEFLSNVFYELCDVHKSYRYFEFLFKTKRTSSYSSIDEYFDYNYDFHVGEFTPHLDI